ncbi:hypothetical protein H6P81_018146 [Aristolochia fimbriata]|uniref:Uncharacterized protein n=1 Tax=Aristolochia fimbriata TaxID=158543 RepID=A0AAV7E395_ARIFI|nr:hypothetical protein H6P81_018146 [Aristolochia fimbriata]
MDEKLAKALLLLVTAAAIAYIVLAGDDLPKAALGVSFYVVFAFLFMFVQALRKTPKTSRKEQEVLKGAVWSLSVILSLMVGYMATTVISSPPVIWAVWGSEGLMGCFLFYWLYASDDINGGAGDAGDRHQPLLAAEEV